MPAPVKDFPMSETQDKMEDQRQEPASETTPRSRALTEYIVLLESSDHADSDMKTWVETRRRIEARTPEAALDALSDVAKGVSRIVVVPASSWHEFEQTTAFKKVT